MFFTLQEAAKMLGMKHKKLRKLCDDGIVPHYRTKKTYIRFKPHHIEAISPGLLGDKIAVSTGYIRPKRLITPNYTSINRGYGVDKYTRNAKYALNLGSGLPWEARGVLSMMVDLMAIHDNNGIPCEPSSYIAGSLGLGQRKWSQSIEPMLISARKIKRVHRGGIDVYVWHDSNYMVGDRTVVEPVREPDPEPVETIKAPSAPMPIAGKIEAKAVQRPIARAAPEHVKPHAPAANPKRVLDVSAYDVLKKAGIDVDGHPRGVFFWARAEHTAKLREWMETVPLSEITVRIDKARIAGRFNDHQNNMSAFEDVVLENG